MALPATAGRLAKSAAFDETARFFDLSHELLATASPDGCFRRLNGAWSELLGYRESELRGRSLVEFVRADDVERTRGEIAKLRAGAKSVDFENHFRASDGCYRWLQWTAHLDGDVAEVVARDVSERNGAQARLKQLLELAPDAMVVVDGRGVIVSVNAHAEELFGYQGSELLGQPVEVLVPERARPAQRDARSRYAADPQARPMGPGLELAGRRKDGSEFAVEVSLAPVAAAEGTLVASAIRDVSERRRLETSRARFAAIVDASSDAIISTTIDGAIESFSPGAERLYGYSAAEAIGESAWMLAEDADESRAALARVVGGESLWFESVRRRKDGSRVDVALTAAPLRDAHGRVVGACSIARDITARLAMEVELRDLARELERHARELEASNRELEAFSYSVSHDLRAPLRAIDGFSNALEHRYAGQLDADGQDMLARVRAATAKMSTLIDALLVLSRLSRRALTLRPLDISALAREIVEELRLREPDRDVEIVIADGLSATGDQTLARTALENLFENAWKFTAHSEAARIELASAGDRSFVVRDNGAGFDMAYADKLFVPFERLHRDDEFTGTGIGLATVERVVHRTGGQLRGEGRVGQGAAFYFDFGGDETDRSLETTR